MCVCVCRLDHKLSNLSLRQLNVAERKSEVHKFSCCICPKESIKMHFAFGEYEWTAGWTTNGQTPADVMACIGGFGHGRILFVS